MNAAPLTIIQNATLVLPEGTLAGKTVSIRGHQIEAITDNSPGGALLNEPDVTVIDAQGCYLTPGLIDQHINGALGCDFNQESFQSIQVTLGKLPQYGITSIAPTIVSAPILDMMNAISNIEACIHHQKPRQTKVLGPHLEGPYLSPEYCGTHQTEVLQERIVPEDLKSLISPNLKIITLDPAVDEQGRFIEYLNEQGIRVQAGHTGASEETLAQAIEKGLSGVSHLYNAMQGFHHRTPGIVGTALTRPELAVELIADGVHVHPSAIRLAFLSKPLSKIILVSDAMQLAGQPEGSKARFASTDVTAEKGRAVNTAGQLAGSTVLLDQAVRNMVSWNITRFQEAILCATLHPAKHLGLDDQIGRIAPGCIADLALWKQDDLSIQATWVEGQLAYHPQGALVS